MPSMTPISRNHEENLEENTGDILRTGDILTPTGEITPVKSALLNHYLLVVHHHLISTIGLSSTVFNMHKQ
jgi:hypothetical protein